MITQSISTASEMEERRVIGHSSSKAFAFSMVLSYKKTSYSSFLDSAMVMAPPMFPPPIIAILVFFPSIFTPIGNQGNSIV